MQPYVIKQGDYLAKLAYEFGFDADAVWNDDQNKDLRELRQDPNILCPCDVLYIPEPSPAPAHSLTTGTTNTFVSDAPTVTVTIRFVDAPLASQAYTVQELPQLGGLTTGGDGTATFPIPVTLETFTIAFGDSGATFTFDVGHLDPIQTPSGILQRLQNLGYVGPDASCDPQDLELLRAGLSSLKAAQAGGGAAGSSTDSDGSSEAAPESAPGADRSPQDNSGLSNDGTLDDDTSKLLRDAHLS